MHIPISTIYVSLYIEGERNAGHVRLHAVRELIRLVDELLERLGVSAYNRSNA